MGSGLEVGVGDLELEPLQGQREHVDVRVRLVRVPIDQLEHEVLASNLLVELHVPFNRLEVLVAPHDRVAVHLLDLEGSLHTFNTRQIDFESDVLVLAAFQLGKVGTSGTRREREFAEGQF